MNRLSRLIIIFFVMVVISLNPSSIGSDQTQPSTNFKKNNNLVILRLGEINTPSHTPPPDVFFMRLGVGATISVNYIGTWSTGAQAAFQYAVDIWETMISSNVTIKVDANWTPLGSGVLGSAGANWWWRDFSGAPVAGTWYPDALADKLFGSDINPSDTDITSNFNSTFSDWYFGTDGNTPIGKVDFATVVLHELCHGLGFIGSCSVSSTIGSWGWGTSYPSVYDIPAINGSFQSLLNTSIFPNPSVALGTELTGDNIFWNGPNAVAAAGGTPPKLYAPSSWEPGSSYSHLDESTYMPGNPHSLMTPVLNYAESNHNPGSITLGMFEDMDWTIIKPTQYFTEVIAGDFDSDGLFDDIAGLNSQGRIWYTTNLSTWTQIPGILANIICGDFDGDGFNDDLAGINAIGRIWYTTNLSTWTQIPGILANIICGDFDSDGINDDIAGINAIGRVWYTTNLSTWTQIPGILTNIICGDFDGDTLNDDIAGLSAIGKIWYTTNLSTWTQIPGTLASLIAGDFDANGRIDDIAGINAIGRVWYTTNLSTWTQIPGILANIIYGDFDGDGINDDIAGNNAIGRVWYTTNLSTWTQIPGY